MSFTVPEQAPARLNRSELAVPGSQPNLFPKAAASDVDVIFLDLEDAVAPPEKLQADGKPIDVFGRPSPSFADFDGDGDLDLLCGEFLDGFTYFENEGSRAQPHYTTGRRLTFANKPIVMDLQMIAPVAVISVLSGAVHFP